MIREHRDHGLGLDDIAVFVAELCRVGDQRFRETSFEDSVRASMRLPFNAVFRQRLDTDTLTRWLQQHPGLRPSIDEATRIDWLRAMLGMLGQPGQPGQPEERRFFVKFESWQATLLPLILRAYPDVPWLFMLRDPVEVIASHRVPMGPS